jgi:N-acetylmuramoyl-L-alanine amidase
MKRHIILTVVLVMVVLFVTNSFALGAYPSGYTIKGIEYKEYSEIEEVKILSSKLEGYNTIRLSNPDRIVIDIPGATAPGRQNITEINSHFIESIRYAQFNAETARIVLDVKNLPRFKIYTAPECLVVYLNSTGEFPYPGSIDRYRENGVSSRGGIDRGSLSPDADFGLDYLQRGSVEELYISINDYKGYKIGTLKNPDRIFIDIPDAKAPLKQRSISVNSMITEAVRYVQFDADTARIVLDVSGDILYDIEEYQGYLKLKLENPWFDKLTYYNEMDRVYLLISDSKFTEGIEANVRFYTDRYENNGLRYVMTFSTDVVDLKEGIININDDILDSIKIIKNSTGKVTSMIFNSKKKFLYKVMTREGYLDTAITVIEPASSGQRIVVIDPGHGGSEPGAIHNGIEEKDLNLDIALRLNELLKSNKIKTYMIREDDSYVGLYERAYIANELDASLFLSIHNNAYDKEYDGTMTLCYSKSCDLGFTGYDFAKIVHESLLKKLGTTDRDIIERQKLVVLRETKMPSVIAEIAFMTNKKDMENLQKESFRQKSAEALCEAVIKALNEPGLK